MCRILKRRAKMPYVRPAPVAAVRPVRPRASFYPPRRLCTRFIRRPSLPHYDGSKHVILLNVVQNSTMFDRRSLKRIFRRAREIGKGLLIYGTASYVCAYKGPSQPHAQIRRGLLIYGTAVKKLFALSTRTLQFYQVLCRPITSPITRVCVSQV